MSDEKHETMDDIVREMRNLGKLDEKSTDKVPRRLMALGLLTYADRIEAAAKREIPQPDPDWETICEKCKDGEILPDNCEYFGEPNGCNSPLYGQHPKEKHGNAAVMRAALEITHDYFNSGGTLRTDAAKAVEAALAAPMKNCDCYTTDKEAWLAWEKHCEDTDMYDEVDEVDLYGQWLFAPSEEQKGGNDGK